MLLFAASLLLAFAALEGGLRLFTPFPIHGEMANRVRHPVLGYTLDPTDDDVDAAGFRNSPTEGPVDIVAIGDSHTQGYNANSEDSWPKQLARRLDRSVYNSGIGGYGVYHYPFLAARAAEKLPSLVLLGLYPANDLSLPKRLSWEYLMGVPNIDSRHFTNTENKPMDSPQKRFRKKLRSTSALASAFAYFSEGPMASPDDFFDVGGFLVRKKKLIKHRDLTDLAIDEVRTGFSNSVSIIRDIAEDLAASEIRFGVVVIPSKERVVYEWARANAVPLPDEFQVLNESVLASAYAERFAELKIDFIDAMPFAAEAFDRAAREGMDFYPLGQHHPAAVGYSSYTDAAVALIDRMGVEFPH